MTRSDLSRRRVIAGSAAAPLLPLAARGETPGNADLDEQVQAALRDAKGTRLVILGSAGGPTLGQKRHMTSHVMLSQGGAYILDCGLGVTDQFVRTGIAFATLRSVFITHHHPDHNIEYGPLLVLGWMRRMPLSVRAFGPPPLRQLTEDFLRAYRTTIDFWAEDFKLPPLTAVEVQEVSAAGPVMQDDAVKVSAAVVNHPPVRPALAYRFDFRDRSFAFSGDTTPMESVAQLAKGADVLVHEVMLVPQTEAYIRGLIGNGRPGSFETIMAHMMADHSPVEAVGRIAAEAGVKTLVLSHVSPPVNVSDEEWRAPAAKYFKGEILVAHDLMVV